MKHIRLVLAGFLIAGAITILSASAAQAACHHFSVKASPASVKEGGKVTVTVSRDAAVAPSNVTVSTIDESAKAGEDYTALHETVSFTDDTSRNFIVSTLKDSDSRPTETFRLHLSNPGGCAVNPNYVVDPDIRVTIANPPPATSRPPTTRPVATQPPATQVGGAPQTSRATPTVAPSESAPATSPPPATAIAQEQPIKERNRRSPWVWVAIGVAVIAVASAAGLYWTRGKRPT